MTVTAAQLKKLFPGANAALVAAVVDGWSQAEAAGIATRQRIAFFLANIGAETGGLKAVSESLNYTAAGLLSTFGRHRISEADAKRLGRSRGRAAQQEEIANTVYGGAWGRKNLGNMQPGDGWTYRGAGMLQTTGRANYAALGFEENPEALRDPATAFSTAVREWAKRGCNALADAGDVVGCRKKINGGTNGLAEVKAYYAKALTIFVGAPASAASKPKPLPVAVASDKSLIEKVQQLLRDRGYPEVGNADGLMGSRTRNAILAFEADNGLPLSGKIDDALLAELIKAPQREVAPERATATAKDLKDAPSIQQGQALSKGGIGAVVVGGIGAVMNGTVSADDLVGHISTARMVYAALGGAVPYLALAAGGVFVAVYGVRFVREQVQAYREGRHV